MSRSNRKQRDKRGRKSKKNNIVKISIKGIAVAALPLALAIGGGAMAINHMNTEQLDANSCYARSDQHVTAIFIDSSMNNSMSKSQRRDLMNSVSRKYLNAPANGRIVIFSTERDTTASVPTVTFEQCRPAKTQTEQTQIGGPEKSTPMLQREQREAYKRFHAFLDGFIEASKTKDKTAVSSPILQQIQAISRHNFGAPLSDFMLFTDGINNSENSQFCQVKGHLPPFSIFKTKPDYAYIRPDDFEGARVEFLMPQDGNYHPWGMKYCSWLELQNFWVAYFEANGAQSVTLTPLGLGAGG